MPFKPCPAAVFRPGKKYLRFAFDREHILSETDDCAALRRDCHVRNHLDRLHAIGAEARIQIRHSVLVQNRRVKAQALSLSAAVARPVRIVYFSIVLVFARGRIADGYADPIIKLHGIVQIIPAVRAAADIGRPHMRPQKPLAGRILPAAVNDALASPVGQIVDGRRPTSIIVFTVILSAKPVMTAKDVEPSVKDMRFSVRHVFIGRKIGIDKLFHCSAPAIFSAHDDAYFPFFVSAPPQTSETTQRCFFSGFRRSELSLAALRPIGHCSAFRLISARALPNAQEALILAPFSPVRRMTASALPK